MLHCFTLTFGESVVLSFALIQHKMNGLFVKLVNTASTLKGVVRANIQEKKHLHNEMWQ